MRWALIDSIIRIEKGSRVLAKAFSPQEEVAAEILYLELMAQAGGVLLGAESDFQSNVILAKVENAEFLSEVGSSEELLIEASSEELRSEGAWVDAIVQKTDGEKVASARIMLANAGDLNLKEAESITFHEQFMNHYQIREKLVSGNE